MKKTLLQDIIILTMKEALPSILILTLRTILPSLLVLIIQGSKNTQVKLQHNTVVLQAVPQQRKNPSKQDYQNLQSNYQALQQKLQMHLNNPGQKNNSVLTLIKNSYQDTDDSDDSLLPMLQLKNEKLTSALQQTATGNMLDNFGLLSAINDLTGLSVDVHSVLETPGAADMFLNKDFSKILKKTDLKLKMRQGL